MKIFTRLIISILFLSMIISCKDTKEPKIFSEDGKALKGYDPVAFFIENKPILGKESFAYDYNNTQWFFSSEENLNNFKNNPEKYQPQYGGYCAFGMSRGYKAPVEIETWSIVNGKLYFNYNKDVQQEWLKDQEGFIEKADKNWMKLKVYN